MCITDQERQIDRQKIGKVEGTLVGCQSCLEEDHVVHIRDIRIADNY